MPGLLKRLDKYPGVNTLDLLKTLAVVAMIIDHVGFYLLGNSELWRSFGRIAAPLFFFIAGYVTKPTALTDLSWRGSLLWLIPPGIILTVLSYFILETVTLNILLSLFAIKLVLGKWNVATISQPALAVLFLLLFICNGLVNPYVEYGTLGFAYAVGGRLLAAERHQVQARLYIVITILLQFAGYWPDKQYLVFFSAVGVLLGVILLSFRFRVVAGLRERFTVSSTLLLVLSRYSLEIYFLHLAALRLLYLSWLLDY